MRFGETVTLSENAACSKHADGGLRVDGHSTGRQILDITLSQISARGQVSRREAGSYHARHLTVASSFGILAVVGDCMM